jgi:hypothetical protein
VQPQERSFARRQLGATQSSCPFNFWLEWSDGRPHRAIEKASRTERTLTDSKRAAMNCLQGRPQRTGLMPAGHVRALCVAVGPPQVVPAISRRRTDRRLLHFACRQCLRRSAALDAAEISCLYCALISEDQQIPAFTTVPADDTGAGPAAFVGSRRQNAAMAATRAHHR